MTAPANKKRTHNLAARDAASKAYPKGKTGEGGKTRRSPRGARLEKLRKRGDQ